MRELDHSALSRRCDSSRLSFKTTDELEPITELVGQPRAVEAVRFGIDIKQEGYNIFALGSPGTGKRTLVMDFLEQRVGNEPTPEDWCYVNNFEEPHKPKALALPAGEGQGLQRAVDRLIEDVESVLTATFEGDEYRRRKQELEQGFSEDQQRALQELEKYARERGMAVVPTAQGLALTPIKEDGKPMTPEEIEQLPEDQREQLQSQSEEVQKEAQSVLQSAPRVQREARRKETELAHAFAASAVAPIFDELQEKYETLPKVRAYLDELRRDVVRNSEEIVKQVRTTQEAEPPSASTGGKTLPPPLPPVLSVSALLRRYRVNVLVGHKAGSGAPLVWEDHPNYPNLIGRVDHIAHMGTLVADFNLIKPGALHRANGGYLILEAHKLLMQSQVWEGLKRAIRAQEIRIDSLHEAMGLLQPMSLEPEAIPLRVKVVLLGNSLLYYQLRALDADFAELFKVGADFGVDMARRDGDQELYARLIATLVKKNCLRPFDRDAVARVIERSSRLAGDAHKLSIHMHSIADVLIEADYWANDEQSDIVQADHVLRAIDAQIFRADRMRERVMEGIERGAILIDTEGTRIGQVNGLAVTAYGDFAFGHPTRISARVRMGTGKVIDIEREVELGEPVHSKGVLILSGYLSGQFAQQRPLSLTASLVFEQSYGTIDGDSASCAELYALLSAIAGVPLKQSLAVTGSMNQHGAVQAIGGVNEKIEGFFDVCRARGLTGEQGVIIPTANIQHLMLRDDVIDAARRGLFHIHAVDTVNEGIELLTGMQAGEPAADGTVPPDSFNGCVAAKLRESADQYRHFRFGGVES